jgi:mono/diheme cytochrome c family protein
MRNFNKKYTMNRLPFLIVVLGIISIVGCYSGGNNTGIEYAPNMYVSEAYEAYTQTEEMKYNPNGMTMRIPVQGTVARGQMDYLDYPEGYEESSSWTNPIRATKVNVTEGGRLYDIYCQHCHGKSGKNDGGVVKSGQYPPPPFENYQTDYIKELSDGKIYHTITHGKGNMGSHAAMLNPEQRWKVLHYVRKLSVGDEFKYATESLQMTSPETIEAADTAEGGSAEMHGFVPVENNLEESEISANTSIASNGTKEGRIDNRQNDINLIK